MWLSGQTDKQTKEKPIQKNSPHRGPKQSILPCLQNRKTQVWLEGREWVRVVGNETREEECKKTDHAGPTFSVYSECNEVPVPYFE